MMLSKCMPAHEDIVEKTARVLDRNPDMKRILFIQRFLLRAHTSSVDIPIQCQ